MIQHTQTIAEMAEGKAIGNCWQTCAASILDLPAEALPDQAAIEREGWSFGNALSCYLAKHHSILRVLLYTWQLKAPIIFHDVYHIICGPSPRTATNGGVNHCVVGRAGRQVWDVHPSRAGLIDVDEMQFFVKVEASELPEWTREARFAGKDCMCPACGGVVSKPRDS